MMSGDQSTDGVSVRSGLNAFGTWVVEPRGQGKPSGRQKHDTYVADKEFPFALFCRLLHINSTYVRRTVGSCLACWVINSRFAVGRHWCKEVADLHLETAERRSHAGKLKAGQRGKDAVA